MLHVHKVASTCKVTFENLASEGFRDVRNFPEGAARTGNARAEPRPCQGSSTLAELKSSLVRLDSVLEGTLKRSNSVNNIRKIIMGSEKSEKLEGARSRRLFRRLNMLMIRTLQPR